MDVMLVGGTYIVKTITYDHKGSGLEIFGRMECLIELAH
jgi:hypothetical protein